ncbi:30S ribosomal protein S6, partial [Candidatus Curtissbacteria bacterium RBG_13_40_7]
MNYELMIVVSPGGEVDPILSRVEKSLKDADATSIRVDKLGKKLLAYPIAKQTEGEYVVINFEAGGEAVGAISKRLKLEQEAILRYLIVKVTKGTKVSKVTKEGKTREEDKTKETGKVVVRTVVGGQTKGTKGTRVSKVEKVTK